MITTSNNKNPDIFISDLFIYYVQVYQGWVALLYLPLNCTSCMWQIFYKRGLRKVHITPSETAMSNVLREVGSLLPLSLSFSLSLSLSLSLYLSIYLSISHFDSLWFKYLLELCVLNVSITKTNNRLIELALLWWLSYIIHIIQLLNYLLFVGTIDGHYWNWDFLVMCSPFFSVKMS